MNEVSHRIVAATLQAAERIAVNPEELIDGLPIDRAALSLPGNIDWEVFVEMVERIDRGRSRARLVAMGRELVRVPALGAMPDLLRFLVNPRRLITTMFRWAGPRDFQHLRTSIVEADKRSIVGRVELPRHYRSSPTFFTILQGCLEALPTLAGHGHAQVRRGGSSHLVDYDILLPPSRPLTAQARQLRQLLIRPGAVMEELGLFQEELRAGWEDSERARAEFLRTLDRLPDSAFIYRNGHLLYANDAFLSALGRSTFCDAEKGENALTPPLTQTPLRAVAEGQPLPPLTQMPLRADAEGQPLPPPILDAAEGTMREFSFATNDGDEVVMEFVSRSDIHFLGIPAVLVVARDITARKALERQLAEQQRLVALGEMAAAIGHEIRNPITTVRLLADNLHRLSEGDISRERVGATAKRLVQTSNRIVEIVARMGTFSRAPTRETPVSTSLAKVVDDAVALCRESFRLRYVTIEYDELDPSLNVLCRPIELGQVLVNLFQNALDATEESEKRWVQLEAHQRDDVTELSITDSGPGVPQTMAKRIFDPFFTTKPVGRGTGLGLSLSRRLIQEQGGELRLDSESEHTRFVLTLPVG